MEKITIEKNDYCEFNDYNDLMINAFEIGCSLCDEPEILFVLKNSPTPIGRLLKDLNKNFSDDEIEKILKEPIEKWQKFDDDMANLNKPTFICSECWNTF